MLKALLVDAGGVLFNNVVEETSFVAELARQYTADSGRVRTGLLASAHRYESGSRHAHTVLRDVLDAAGGTGAFDGRWVDRLYLALVRRHNDNVAALAGVLRAYPKLTAVLANNEAEHWDELKNAHFGHYRHVHRLCSSWRLGAVKPESGYFAALLEDCQIEPHEALMVDDRAAVLDTARALGMATLHISDPTVLRDRLSVTVDDLWTPIRTR